MSVSELVRSVSETCQQQVEGLHVLAISDSSEINLQAHAGRINPAGLGVVGNNRDKGFFIHPTLVVNAETGFPLGLSTIQLWHREVNHLDKHQRRYPNLPIEQKESYKWVLSAERSEPCLQAGGVRLVTHIGDRESDLGNAIDLLFLIRESVGMEESTQPIPTYGFRSRSLPSL